MGLFGAFGLDVRTETLFANQRVFRIKPLKVKLLAREQKATKLWGRQHRFGGVWGGNQGGFQSCGGFHPSAWDFVEAQNCFLGR